MSNDTITHVQAAEVDTRIAELLKQQARIQSQQQSLAITIRHAARQTSTYDRKTGTAWSGTLAEAIDAVQARIAAGETWYNHTLDDYDAEARKLAEVNASLLTLNELYAKHRWSRFYLVLNNNGHIHRDTSCSTCFATTEYGWLPQLSGLTEADAVADQGEILCSICFPSAPVAWTCGESKAKVEARQSRDAQRAAARAKKAAKALFENNVDAYLSVGERYPEFIGTIAAAKSFLTNHFDWSPAAQKDVDNVAEHLARRLGTTPEIEIEAARKRAAKRR